MIGDGNDIKAALDALLATLEQETNSYLALSEKRQDVAQNTELNLEILGIFLIGVVHIEYIPSSDDFYSDQEESEHQLAHTTFGYGSQQQLWQAQKDLPLFPFSHPHEPDGDPDYEPF